MIYSHSPKAVVIAGAPAAGKSTVAQRLCDELGCELLRLDGINVQIATKLGIPNVALRQPSDIIQGEYKSIFLRTLRELRYRNIVLEGCWLSLPHIFLSFQEALLNCYGDHVLLKCFYLNPPREVREKQYILRQAQLAKQVAKSRDDNTLALLKKEHEKGFCGRLEQPLPGFELVEDPAQIVTSVAELIDRKHPGLRPEHEELYKAIAESGAYNPFYQRVEVGGEVVIGGFTDSMKSWENILKLQLDFAGKKVCDIGCMLGYFTFKFEEAGAQAYGIDVDDGAILGAQAVARARRSTAQFAVHNAEAGFESAFDIIFALNVLHRVADFTAVCNNIFAAAKEVVLEVGERQLKDLITLSKPFGFRTNRSLKSHRCSEVVGQRIIVHLVKQA